MSNDQDTHGLIVISIVQMYEIQCTIKWPDKISNLGSEEPFDSSSVELPSSAEKPYIIHIIQHS
jgi:hypothetical protein